MDAHHNLITNNLKTLGTLDVLRISTNVCTVEHSFLLIVFKRFQEHSFQTKVESADTWSKYNDVDG